MCKCNRTPSTAKLDLILKWVYIRAPQSLSLSSDPGHFKRELLLAGDLEVIAESEEELLKNRLK